MNVILTGAEGLQKWADGKVTEMSNAQFSAIKGAGYWLMKRGRGDLQGGALGLAPLSPLTKKLKEVQGRMGGRGVQNRSSNPLANLYRGITYQSNKTDMVSKVGFIGSSSGTMWQRSYAYKSLSSYLIPISKAFKVYLYDHGIDVKSTTNALRVPARDIIDAISRKHGSMALIKLKEYFEVKMAGGRF